jgi:hypothetical protein
LKGWVNGMSWLNQLKGDTLSWLLEPENPGVRYLAMRDILDKPAAGAEFSAAKASALADGPIAAILNAMAADGYWVEPGAGYYPKYRGTVWSIISLAQLGAHISWDRRIEQACQYVLENTLADGGQFSASGSPSGTADCLQGNLCAALLDLGVRDQRLDKAFEWMARSVSAEGVATMDNRQAPVRYYAGKCGPLFACGSNNKMACAWGGVKVMLAFSKLPMEQRTALIQRAIQKGVDFFFSIEPASAAYPSGWSAKPSQNWWKFGFPVFYVTDLLQLVEALSRLGCADDSRLADALKIIREKQDEQGRWALEYDYSGKTWVDFGVKKQPNKWVTLRAVQVLKACQIT